MPKARITVLHRAFHRELTEQLLDEAFSPQGKEACTEFRDDQTFTIDGFPGKPDYFPCDWAWADIHRSVSLVLFGGGAPWIRPAGSMVTCCTDGLRPVTFLVERIGEEQSASA